MTDTTNIYILKLKNNKYYVGKSNDPQKRFKEHISGNGSSFTKKYKPISIEKIIPLATKYVRKSYAFSYLS
jgi:predicted GIY-YIG superfamily endonuclease